MEIENNNSNGNILGTKPVGKLLLSLAIPAIIGQIVNLLYNMVDRIYIGHIPVIGGDALTGVGVTAPLIIIISSFAALVGMGGAPQAAIRIGKNDTKGAEKILGNSFSMLTIFSVLLTIFFLTFNERLLLMFGASEVTLPYALEYMNIYTLGTFFVLMTSGLNSFITTQGFSKIGMATVLIGAIINIVLDPIFIFTFDMGVKGAALATIISQGISAIWVLYFLTGKNTNLRIKKKNIKLKKGVVLPVLALGLAPFIMQVTESALTIVLNTNLFKHGGDVAVGTNTILTSAMQFVFLPLVGIAQGAQPIISYNYGAKNKDRLIQAFKYLLTASVVFSTVSWLFFMIMPQVFASMITPNTEIVKMSTWGLRIFMSSSLVLGVQVACQQSFIAFGNAKTSIFLAFLRKVLLLIPLIYIMPLFFKNKSFGVFIAEPIADFIAVTITFTMFRKFFKETINSI